MTAKFHVAHILCTGGGGLVFSHKQNLNSDLDCITQNTGALTQAKTHTQSLSTALLQWVAFSFQKASDLQTRHTLHSKGEPQHKTHRCKRRWRRTEFSCCEWGWSGKNVLIYESSETFSRLSSWEQLKGHIPSRECKHISKANKSNNSILASLHPRENYIFITWEQRVCRYGWKWTVSLSLWNYTTLPSANWVETSIFSLVLFYITHVNLLQLVMFQVEIKYCHIKMNLIL